MLEFQHVSLSLGKKEVLRDMHFSVFPGELVAILGTSGAGKSSLFKLLIGEEKPTAGSLRLDNFALERLSSANLQKYRRQIGIVFQNFRLLPGKTVFENVAFALEVCGEGKSVAVKVPKLLHLVGLWDKRNQFPASLSGGEVQRTAIARALVHSPKLLLADEPTGNLDPANSKAIAELFGMLHQKEGITVVLATHDPLVIQTLLPRVIRLNQGKITFDGDVKTSPEAFREFCLLGE